MKRVTWAAISTALLVLGLVFAVTAPAPAHAAGLRPAVAMAPAVQICENDFHLCVNRDGGGTSIGTQVISYFFGDNNNDAEWIWLSAYCGHGHVTLSCPNFHNSNINGLYNGRIVVAVEMNIDTGPISCLGRDGLLDYCPNPDGSCPVTGRCLNTVFMLSNCSDIVNCGGTVTAALNYRWTVDNGTQSWLRIPYPAGQKIIVGWHQLPAPQVEEF